jgi:hypothetical protein
MSVSYSIEKDLLRLTLEGEYAPDDIVRTFLDAIDDPKCPTPVALLVDVSRSSSLATRPVEQIRTIAERLGDYKERVGGRCAVLASSDVNFGLSRLGSVYSEGVGVSTSVFRDLPEALAWLGVTRPNAS